MPHVGIGNRGVGSMPTPRGGSSAADHLPLECPKGAHDAPRPFGLVTALLVVGG